MSRERAASLADPATRATFSIGDMSPGSFSWIIYLLTYQGFAIASNVSLTVLVWSPDISMSRRS